MTTDDVRYIRFEDTARLDERGEPLPMRTVVFRIGVHGPFTEHIPKDANFDGELRRRVDALKITLANLPR